MPMPSHQLPSWAKWWRSCRTTHARESFPSLQGGPACLGSGDLVAMSSQIPWTLPNLLTQPFNQIPYRNLTNLNLHAWLLEPQPSEQQGFSEAVAARIEAHQRGSTRSVYKAKWTIFTKWCLTNQVDCRAPPVKSTANFLVYLFQIRKLQPSTIDGCR